jgi:rod shape-determining protein MreD
MKDFLIFLPITLLFLAVKSTIPHAIPLFDLPLLITFYVAYRRPAPEGVVLAFTLGYLEDVFSGALLGVTSFGLIIVYATVYLLSKKVDFQGAAMKVGGAGAMSLVAGFAAFVIMYVKDLQVPAAAYILPEAVVTALFAPPLIGLLARLTEKSTRRRGRQGGK